MKEILMSKIEKTILIIIATYFLITVFIFLKYPNIFKTTFIFLVIITFGNLMLWLQERFSISKTNTFYEDIIKRNQMIRLWTSLILVCMSAFYFLSEFGIFTKDKLILLNINNCGVFLIFAISGNYSLNVSSNDLVGINKGVFIVTEKEFKFANNLHAKLQFWTGILAVILTLVLPSNMQIFDIPIGLHLMTILIIFFPVSVFISKYFARIKS